MNMSPDDNARLLARLQSEFLTDEGHLAELERALTAALANARHFGRKQGAPVAWDALWQQHWDDVARYLQRIQLLLREMEQYTQGSSPDLLQAAMEAWEEMQGEHVQLTASLNAIQQQAITLDAAVRTDWNAVVHSVEPHLSRLHTFATVLRIRLELLRSNSREGVDSLVRDLLATLPGHSPAEEPDPSLRQQPGPQNAGQVEEERLEPGGLMDTIKALLMWVDKPVNQTPVNPAAQSDEAGKPGTAPAAHSLPRVTDSATWGD